MSAENLFRDTRRTREVGGSGAAARVCRLRSRFDWCIRVNFQAFLSMKHLVFVVDVFLGHCL